MFQSYALFPNMTVEENIAVGIKGSKTEKNSITAEMIGAFYLTGLEKKRPAQLSGGQQQRVALARLLAARPEIILLDEPFSALDSHLKWKLERELYGVVKAFEGLTLMVSHNRDEIYRMCEKFAVFSSGQIDCMADRKALFKNPKTVDGALLTGCKNVSAIRRIDDYSFFALDWGIILHTGQKITPDITHVGMRRHYLYYASKSKSDKEDNIIELAVTDEIENPFSYIILLKNINGGDGEKGEIQWEVGKSTWDRIKSRTIKIIFPKERLLLLKSNEVRTK
jgi:molybdate transport system ATP-binding protein